MSTKTSKTAINAALKLLKKEGYTVEKKRPDPRIGDVVRMHYDDGTFDDVLITFHQLDRNGPDDVFPFGGVVVSERKYNDQYTEAMWIDENEWARVDGQYEIIGHVNLDKWIKR